jgi:hypothetical protein
MIVIGLKVTFLVIKVSFLVQSLGEYYTFDWNYN